MRVARGVSNARCLLLVLYPSAHSNSMCLQFVEDENKYDLDFKNAASEPADWITADALTELYQGFIEATVCAHAGGGVA